MCALCKEMYCIHFIDTNPNGVAVGKIARCQPKLSRKRWLFGFSAQEEPVGIPVGTETPTQARHSAPKAAPLLTPPPLPQEGLAAAAESNKAQDIAQLPVGAAVPPGLPPL